MQPKANYKPVREKVDKTTGIYRRKTRSGETRYDVSYVDSDGKQRWSTAARLEDAKQLRQKLSTRVASGELVRPTRITLTEYVDGYIDGTDRVEGWLSRQTALRPRTHDVYSSWLRLHVKPRLGRRPIQSITVEDVAELIASMKAGERYEKKDGRVELTKGKPFAPWTIRGTVMVLGRVLGSATRAGVIPGNPVRRLEVDERPKIESRDFPLLDRKQIGRLIAATPVRYRLIVATSVLTGLRQGESLGLRWQDVDTRAGVIRVRHQLDRSGELVEPKTKAARREIPIPPSLAKALARQKVDAFAKRRAKPTDFVFSSESGGPMHRRNMARRGLDEALKTTKLPHLRWHDLRHVAASVLIAQGASVPYVSRVLGHKNSAITLSIYAHLFAAAEHADETRERMEAAFGGLI